MNVKLDSVISDRNAALRPAHASMGLTGQRILRAIIGGE